MKEKEEVTRTNIALKPHIKDGITRLAALQGISSNQLANATFQKLLDEYSDDLAEFDALTAKSKSKRKNVDVVDSDLNSL